MFYRRRLLLALLETLNGKVSRRDFQEHVLLLTRGQTSPSYDFIPYRYGCYSFTLEADRRALIRHGWLLDSSVWVFDDRALLPTGASNFHSTFLSNVDQAILELHSQQWGTVRGNRLIKEVYTRYPDFATRNEIAEHHLSPAELHKVHECIPAPLHGPALFTIGYQGKSFEAYLQQLLDSQVDVLCDVRSNPRSRKIGFSSGPLMRALEDLGIEYQHYPNLGIASDARRNLQSQSDYAHLLAEYRQITLRPNATDQQSIVRLLTQCKRVALTCFELEPHQCHRSSLAEALVKNYSYQHLQPLSCDNL